MLWLAAVGLTDSVNVHFWPKSFLMFILLTYTHSLAGRVLVLVCYIDWCLHQLIIRPALAHSQCSKSCLVFCKELKHAGKACIGNVTEFDSQCVSNSLLPNITPKLNITPCQSLIFLCLFLAFSFASSYPDFALSPGLFSSSSISLHVCDWGRTVVVHWM